MIEGVEITDKTVGIWYVDVRPGMNWLCHLSGVDGDLLVIYRFRYYTDPRPWAKDDRTNWYKAHSFVTRERGIESCRAVAAVMRNVDGTTVHELLMDSGGTDEFMERFIKLPFVNVKIIGEAMTEDEAQSLRNLYKALLKHVEDLVARDPPKDTPEGTMLAKLAAVLERNEEVAFPTPRPPGIHGVPGGTHDVPGECNARLFLSDDHGDNECTIRCNRPPGHEGVHREDFDRDGDPVVIVWTRDERLPGDK